MSKPKPPKPPDPVATVNAQTQSNRDTAVAESYLNNVDQNTPYGSVRFDVSGYGPNGIPRWSQTVTESDNQRQMRELEERQGISLGQLGLEQTGRVSDILGQPYNPRRFNTEAATGGRLNLADALGTFDRGRYDPTNERLDLSRYDPSTLGNFGDDVRSRSFDLATRGMDRAFGRAEESLRSTLANQGVNAGTEAFGEEMRSFNEGKGDAFAKALLAADDNALRQRAQATGELGQAGANRGAEFEARLGALGQGFNQDMMGRHHVFDEMAGERGINLSEALQQYNLDTTADQAARTNPLNEIIALTSGVQTNPLTPGRPNAYGINGTDVGGIYGNDYATRVDAYNAKMQGRAGLIEGLSRLGSAAIGRIGR